jgi:hypothetical protein
MSRRQVFRAADGLLIPPGFHVGRLRRWDEVEISEHIANGCPPLRRGGTVMTSPTPSSRKRRGRTGRINAPSPRRDTAAALVRQLVASHLVVEGIDQRGGIVAVLDEAQLGEPDRVKLVASLKHITVRTRSYIAAVGDDRRQRGVAIPLCSIPKSESPAEHPHDTAGDSPNSHSGGVPIRCQKTNVRGSMKF